MGLHRRILGETWIENMRAIREGAGGPIDLVVFTGDVANWRRADEYAMAHEFFLGTLKALDVPIERFFTIPGNQERRSKRRAC